LNVDIQIKLKILHMIVSTDKKQFLVNQVPDIIKKLRADTAPNFGLMTPQHMVEHLIWVTKSSLKRKGDPPAEATKSQAYFRKFLDSGAQFKYKPKAGQTKDDLPALRFGSLDEAVAQIPDAVSRIFSTFEEKPSFKSYNDMMGEFTKSDHELMHYEHFKWHLFQFGLIDKYHNDEA